MSYSVIPPYILRNIIDNCSGAQQDYARPHPHPRPALDGRT
ncbi:hypothetical protein Q3H59_001076 [Pantoea sp. SORGH_AS 659]|nr:hypothetical protein [Pantoea sp. SORGH_AS_0659]